MFLLSFYLCGTNYPQQWMLTVGYSLFILILFIRKNPKKWLYTANWIFMGLCIGVSVIAPGNFMNYRKHVNLYYTVFTMLRTFTTDLSSNPTVTISLLVSILTLPFIIKMTSSSKTKYIKPYLFALGSFLILFSMYTPSAFIFNNEGPLRQINIRIMVMQLMIYVNFINMVGFYTKNENKKISMNPTVAFGLILILLIMSFSNGKMMEAWSIKTQYSIMGLEVSKFTGRANDSFKELEDQEVKSVDMSDFITHEMLMPNIYSYIHYNLEAFYNKDDVIYFKEE